MSSGPASGQQGVCCEAQRRLVSRGGFGSRDAPDVRVGTQALLCRRSLRAGTEERFVIKALVFEHILLSLLGRPPTFLAEEVLGSAEFCREFLAFMIHVKINVLSRRDLVGLSGPSPGPASAAAA